MKTSKQIEKRIKRRDMQNILTLLEEISEEMYQKYEKKYTIDLKERFGYIPSSKRFDDPKIRRKFRKYGFTFTLEPPKITIYIGELPNNLSERIHLL